MVTQNDGEQEMDWLEAELADTLDEDYELELSEPALSLEIRRIYRKVHPPSLDRREYFHNLLALQSELIKLQDWVSHTKAKIVVVFEGRDAAGKGGVIKRITERLSPRVCRVVALGTPTEREKTRPQITLFQWIDTRDAMCVLDGFLHDNIDHIVIGDDLVLCDCSLQAAPLR